MSSPCYRYHSRSSVPLAILASLAMSATASAGDIVLSLEEPVANSTYTGIANIRGWVVGSSGISRVELYMDGVLKTNIPVGGQRSDVGTSYPTYPNSDDSGFSMAYNYSDMAAGGHTILVRAIDKEGISKDASATFNTTRFDNSFITNPASVNLNSAVLSHNGQSITINNLVADGKNYDIRLDWRQAIQGYAITQIIPTGSSLPSSDFSGTWKYTGSLASNNCVLEIPIPNNLAGTLRISQNDSQLSGVDVELEQSFSGTVDAQSNFSLTSQLFENGDVCKVQAYTHYTGNFIQQVIAGVLNVQTAGTCAIPIECAARYQGTVQKTVGQ